MRSKSRQADLFKSIEACQQNGERLIEEGYMLEFEKPASTRFYLVMVAQEEFAKRPRRS